MLDIQKHTQKKTGRPIVEIDGDLFDNILECVASGKTLNRALKELSGGKISRNMFINYISRNPDLEKKYDFSRARMFESIADEILDFSDDSVEFNDGRPAEVQARKLQIESRKWLLSKLAPQKYGDRVQLDHGGQAGNPLISEVVFRIVDPKKCIENA